MPNVSSEQTAALGTPSTFDMCELPTSSVKATLPQGLDSSPAQLRGTAHTLKPLYIVHNIQSEEAVHLGTNTPCLVPCLQAPEAFVEDPDEAGGVAMMEDGAPAPLEDSKVKKSVFAAETADAEALQPHTLVETKHKPDWPFQKKAIKEHPATVKAADTQGPEEALPRADTSKTGISGINPDPKPLSAPMDHQVLHLTDLAPASAVECAIPCNVPLRKAVIIPTWAVLAAHPDATLFDANGSKAIDRHATLGHAFPIDDSATCWPLRQLEDVPLTTKCDYIAATHSGKEAQQPHSPVLDTFRGFNALTPSFSDHPAPLAFTRDYQDHPPDCTYHHAAQLDHTGLQPEDDMVAIVPSNPQTSTMEKHFVASHGLHTK